MKRKLVKQGAATLMISLPSKWLKKFNLAKGNEIDLEEADDKLIITKEGIEGRKDASITITKKVESSLRALLVNAYRSGYDHIKIKFEGEKQFNEVKDAIKGYVLGYDITKKEKDYCIVESITDPSPEQFDAIMNKIFFNIKELVEITRKRLNGEKEHDDYVEIGLRIHQYSSFCRRVVSKGKKEVKDIHLFWTFHTLLVHAQRDLYHLNKYLDKNPFKASKETLNLLDGIIEMTELLLKGYTKKDTRYLEEIHHKEKELIYIKGYSTMSKIKGKESVAVHHLISSIRNFYLASSPLMGLFLENEAIKD